MRRNALTPFGWTPIDDLFRIHDGLSTVLGGSGRPRVEAPAMGVWTNDEGVRITAEVPGLGPDDVEVSLDGARLTIAGTFPTPEVPEGFQPHRTEHKSGAFTRTVELPFEVDNDRVEAKLMHGVLELTIPRAEKEKPFRIPVRTGS